MKLKEIFKTKLIVGSPGGELELSFASGIPEKEVKKNGAVNIKVHPQSADRPLNGYSNESEVIMRIINLSIEKNKPILLRFEQVRKKDIDPTIPIADLKRTMDEGRKNTIKRCVGVYDYNNNKWILSTEAQSDPDQDPADVAAVIRGAIDVDVDEGTFFQEKKPFIPLTEKFHKNQQVITMYFFVKEQETKHGFELTEDRRLEVAKLSLIVANKIQQHITKSDYVNYNGYEHTRARAMVFNMTEHFYPLTKDIVESDDKLKDWVANILVNSTRLLNKVEEND